MTRSTGVGRGGKRPGAGRKPKPAPDPDARIAEMIAEMTPQEIMDTGMRECAVAGRWKDAAKIAKDLELLRRPATKPAGTRAGKKEAARVAAETAATAGGASDWGDDLDIAGTPQRH